MVDSRKCRVIGPLAQTLQNVRQWRAGTSTLRRGVSGGRGTGSHPGARQDGTDEPLGVPSDIQGPPVHDAAMISAMAALPEKLTSISAANQLASTESVSPSHRPRRSADDSGTVESGEATEQLIERLNCRGHAAGGWASAAADRLSRPRLRRSSRLTSRNLGEHVDSRPLTLLLGSTVAEIVQCGEPIPSTSYGDAVVQRGPTVPKNVPTP